MKISKIKHLFISSLFFPGLLLAAGADQSPPVRISPGINLSVNEVLSATSPYASDMNRHPYSFEILIYYYSSGIETTTYSPDGKEAKITEKGILKAAVKFRKHGKFDDVIFVYAFGDNKKEILESFASEMKKINLLRP